jgi:hypothetical protein
VPVRNEKRRQPPSDGSARSGNKNAHVRSASSVADGP